jgi:hypothetical protein
MKKMTMLIIIFLMVISIGACGDSDSDKSYYEDTYIEDLETFTSLTGVDVNIQNDLDTGILYSYIVNVDAEGLGAVTKYYNYLEQNGYTKSNIQTEAGTIYVKDSNMLMVQDSQFDNVIQFTIVVPKISPYSESSEADDISSVNELEQLMQYCESEDYASAQKFYLDSSLQKSDDKDTAKKYYLYAEGMEYYENGVYGEAYKLLSENTVGILRTDDVLKDISDAVGFLDGVYENQSVGYSGMYMIIKDGRVDLDIKDRDELKNGVYYFESIIDYTFTHNNTSTYAISNGALSKDDIQYIMASIDSDSITLIAMAGNNYTTFNGVYKKTSIAIPKALN